MKQFLFIMIASLLAIITAAFVLPLGFIWSVTGYVLVVWLFSRIKTIFTPKPLVSDSFWQSYRQSLKIINDYD